MLRKIESFITKIEPPNWVLAIIAIATILRIPSLIGPYYYGDEMIYLTLGNAIRKGVTLYSQIHDNKPPLLYLTAALAGNLFWFRAILMFWMLATIILFWHLIENLFKGKKNAQIISVSVFIILTTLPLLEGQIVNAELFLIGPIILGILLLLKNPSSKNIIIAGIAFAVAVLFKVPAIFDIPVIFIYWIISSLNKKDFLIITKRALILIIAFLIPIAFSFMWFYFHNAASDYLKIAFLQNIGYLSSWNGNPNTSFIVKHGALLINAAIVLIGLALIKIYSSKLSKPFLVSSIWLLTSLFAVTLSGRPYPHYLIQAVPPIAILVGVLVTSVKFEQVLTIIPLALAVFVPVYYHFWYYPTTPYYTNFIKLISHQESKWEYFQNIDKNSVNNYKVSELVVNMTSSSDKIFVWGEEAPTIYALTKRLPALKYTADYHITDYSSLATEAQSLDNNPPLVIVILSGSPKFPELNSLLNKKYVLINNSGNTSEIWHFLAK